MRAGNAPVRCGPPCDVGDEVQQWWRHDLSCPIVTWWHGDISRKGLIVPTDATPEPSAASARLAEKLLAMVNDPEHKNRLAAQEAARTDPWRWYCRTCGAEGGDPARTVRNDEARRHLDETRCGRGTRLGEAESGRLLHVWTY